MLKIALNLFSVTRLRSNRPPISTVLLKLLFFVHTLLTTKSFGNVLMLRRVNGRVDITFWNNTKLNLDWKEYRMARQFLVQGYEITIDNKDVCLRKDSLELTYPYSEDVFDFYSTVVTHILPRKYVVTQRSQDLFAVKGIEKLLIQKLENGIYYVESQKFKLYGPLAILSIVFSLLEGDYDCDFESKTVLDIGGFFGETAVFFSSLGAKKLVVYEPVVERCNILEENLTLNKVNATIFYEGIGSQDGHMLVSYEPDKYAVTNSCFGILNTGPSKMLIKIRNIADVIKESKADIAKLDCEGAEVGLLNVSNCVLREIGFYIIEVHTRGLRKAIVNKFREAGFQLVREVERTPPKEHKLGNVLHFQRS